MNATEKKIAVLLAGTGVIPIPEECLKEIFVDNHSMFTEESKEGESEVNFMKRAFCKALRKESIVNSTKQCMIINAPVGHGKMSSEEIGLLSTYINRWTNNAEHYSMNWGLYEIPNTTKIGLRYWQVRQPNLKPKRMKRRMSRMSQRSLAGGEYGK